MSVGNLDNLAKYAYPNNRDMELEGLGYKAANDFYNYFFEDLLHNLDLYVYNLYTNDVKTYNQCTSRLEQCMNYRISTILSCVKTLYREPSKFNYLFEMSEDSYETLCQGIKSSTYLTEFPDPHNFKATYYRTLQQLREIDRTEAEIDRKADYAEGILEKGSLLVESRQLGIKRTNIHNDFKSIQKYGLLNQLLENFYAVYTAFAFVLEISSKDSLGTYNSDYSYMLSRIEELSYIDMDELDKIINNNILSENAYELYIGKGLDDSVTDLMNTAIIRFDLTINDLKTYENDSKIAYTDFRNYDSVLKLSNDFNSLERYSRKLEFRNLLDKYLVDTKKACMSFDGWVYENRQEVDTARKFLTEKLEYVKTLKDDDIDELKELRKAFGESNLKSKSKYTEYILSILSNSNIPLDVLGYTFESDKDAKEMRKRCKEVFDLFISQAFSSIDDLNKLEAQVHSIINNEVVEKQYIARIDNFRKLYNLSDELSQKDLNYMPTFVEKAKYMSTSQAVSESLKFFRLRNESFTMNFEKSKDIFLTIYGNKFNNISDAINYYITTTKSAVDYKKKLDEKDIKPSGFFGKLKKGLKDMLNTGTEEDYNLVTENGTQPLPYFTNDISNQLSQIAANIENETDQLREKINTPRLAQPEYKAKPLNMDNLVAKDENALSVRFPLGELKPFMNTMPFMLNISPKVAADQLEEIAKEIENLNVFYKRIGTDGLRQFVKPGAHIIILMKTINGFQYKHMEELEELWCTWEPLH